MRFSWWSKIVTVLHKTLVSRIQIFLQGYHPYQYFFRFANPCENNGVVDDQSKFSGGSNKVGVMWKASTI